LKVPLPKFVAIRKDDDKDNIQFFVRVELEAEGIVGSYTKPELALHTCVMKVD
jgi:hypothetical protein